METIIHIGQHKTGTTSLQHYLYHSRQELLDKGILYPEKLLHFRNSSHFMLNIYALAANRSSYKKEYIVNKYGLDSLASLNKELPSDIRKTYEYAAKRCCEQVIWSNEGLYLLNSIEEYERLIDLFRPYSSKIIVVCCFRDRKAFKNSYENELIKLQTTPSVQKDSYRYTAADSWLFDYERKRNLLAEVFDDCLYFNYHPEDNVQPFLDLLAIQLQYDKSYRLNTSEKITLKDKLKVFLSRFVKYFR